MVTSVTFILDGTTVTIDFNRGPYSPTTTLLQYLRSLPNHKGTKEGCAEGDCGACTVVLAEPDQKHGVRYRSVDSCLILLPMIHGRQVITVENVAMEDGSLHRVQSAMAEGGGSQCGYCTPGFIMSMYALSKSGGAPSREDIDDALTGNLCRCTGYKPIVQAAHDGCSGINRSAGKRDGIQEIDPESRQALSTIPAGSLSLATSSQSYFRPVTLGEAVTLKHGRPGALLLSGATDIALRVTKAHELLPEIIDLSGIEELKGFQETDNSYVFGAGMTLTDIMNASANTLPALRDMLAVFGSRQIRNVATIAGNLGTASPIGDLLPVLMAYDASVVLEGLNGKRTIRVNEFFISYRKTVRKPEEIIVSIIIPKPSSARRIKAYKVSKRKDMDISSLSGVFALDLEGDVVREIILAYGGMADRPVRASAAENFLKGGHWVRPVVEEAMDMIGKGFSPLSDVRASSQFRTAAAKNLLLKFWHETNDKNNGS